MFPSRKAISSCAQIEEEEQKKSKLKRYTEVDDSLYSSKPTFLAAYGI
jgi:hypothetical protein